MAYEDEFDENGTPKGYPGYNGTKGRVASSPDHQKIVEAENAQRERDSGGAKRFDPGFKFSDVSKDAATSTADGSFWQNFAKQQAGANRSLAAGELANANSTREQQNSLLQDVMNQARGTQMRLNPQTGKYEMVPVSSLAQMQLQQASDRDLAQAKALAGSQRGMGHAALQSQVANQRAAIGQQQAADSGILRLQEQQAAQQMAAQLQGQIRGQDIQQAGTVLQGQSLNDTQQRAFAELGARAAAGDRDAIMAMEQLRLNNENNQNTLRLGAAGLNQKTDIDDKQMVLAREKYNTAKTEAERAFWLDVIKFGAKAVAGAATGGASLAHTGL